MTLIKMSRVGLVFPQLRNFYLRLDKWNHFLFSIKSYDIEPNVPKYTKNTCSYFWENFSAFNLNLPLKNLAIMYLVLGNKLGNLVYEKVWAVRLHFILVAHGLNIGISKHIEISKLLNYLQRHSWILLSTKFYFM